MTIIALAGKKRVGKDEAAKVLVSRYGFTRIALADPLKALCIRVFHLDPKIFDEDQKDAQMPRLYLDFHDIDKIRKIVEEEWNYTIQEESRDKMEELHGEYFDTPRDILRCVGTTILRNCVSDSIWLDMAALKVKEIGQKVVITDCRFQNERDTFAKMGAVLCLIKRNDNGESKEHEFNLGKDDEYDVVFTNDGTLQEYKSSVDMWYNSKQAEFNYYRVWKNE